MSEPGAVATGYERSELSNHQQQTIDIACGETRSLPLPVLTAGASQLPKEKADEPLSSIRHLTRPLLVRINLTPAYALRSAGRDNEFGSAGQVEIVSSLEN